MTTVDRIRQFMANSEGPVILRREVVDTGSPSQVSRSLATLIKENQLVRVGTGIYVKTRISSVTGNVIPAGSLETVATEVLRKLGIPVGPSWLVEEYNSGRSTQIPAGFTVNTGKRRITRRITVGKRTLLYENDITRKRVQKALRDAIAQDLKRKTA